MQAKTHEMSKMPSPRHAEMSAELEALRRARDQLKVECTELQSKTNDDLSDEESRRYATTRYIFTSYFYLLQLILLISMWKRSGICAAQFLLILCVYLF